jgi:hypothetical protein
MSKITDLTESLPDYPALQQFARALWRDGSVRGAAVLVGAGFSKNAISPADDTARPPLWGDLCHAMATRLYPTEPTDAPTNPLRLAEEYRTYFGQAALDDFIRAHFPDRAWQPGALHTDLLNFPWSDVLTTNWDTLLERAADNAIDETYDIVRVEADLPHARAPRVVKLHGSIGDEGPLIFAEEDYRMYPVKHAAFVNLARQIFIENELCLIGFSGEDPNFLQWTGWVRDQLGGKARRIYLVGCLNLAPAKRKFLELHNIAPIDFAPLLGNVSKSERHTEASRLFLAVLKASKPNPLHKWTPTSSAKFPLAEARVDVHQKIPKDDALAADLLFRTASLIKRERETYPRWLVCPANLRTQMRFRSDEAWLLRSSVLDHFKVSVRAEILLEFVWQRTTSFSFLPPQLIDAVTALLDSFPSEVEAQTLCKFAVALMRHARLSDDEEVFHKWEKFVESNASTLDESRHEAKYQRCLFERDRLNLDALSKAIDSLDATDTIWSLRRAALLTEVGQYVQATKLIREASADYERRYRLDRASLWVRARLGWAEWIARGTHAASFRPTADLPKPREFKELLVDPLDEIQRVETTARERYTERKADDAGFKPLFDAGHYRQSRSEAPGSIDGGAATAFYQLDQLIEVVGLPVRTSDISFCSETALAVMQATHQKTVYWYIWLIRGLHSHFDKLFDVYFSRIAVAQLQDDVCRRLVTIIKSAVDYWARRVQNSQNTERVDDSRGAGDRLRLHLIVLSRLSVRMPESDAREMLLYAFAMAREPWMRHGWILEALDELANQSASALSQATQGSLALEIMEFPLADEVQADTHSWPDVINRVWESTPERVGGESRWKHRIQELIAAAQSGQNSRTEALHRLSYLSLRNVLEPDERASVAGALWSEVDDQSKLPEGTGLITAALADLPAPDGIDAKALVRARLFEGDKQSEFSVPTRVDTRVYERKILGAQSLVLAAQIGIKPSAAQAVKLFDELVAWRPPQPASEDPVSDSWTANFVGRMRPNLGGALANLLAPALDAAHRTPERARALLEWATASRDWHGLAGLPEFIETCPELANEVEAVVRRALVGTLSHRVENGTTALTKWTALVRSGKLTSLPESLTAQLISTIESRHEHGLQALLYAARILLVEGLIPERLMSHLLPALSDLWAETRYADIDPTSRKAISLSLVRGECVRLAHVLKTRVTDDGTLAEWIAAANSDPLPEVRLALINPQK